MNKIAKRFFSILFLFIAVTSAMAQQVGSNSPYGRYGVGLLSNQTLGASEAMGGISYGIRRSQQVNPGNPASYSKLDTLTFIFDFGISGHYSSFTDGTNKQHLYNGNLDYVAIQFPIIRKLGASVGLLPYSKVGYKYGESKSVSNVIYDEIFRGDGGLSQIYAGVAYEPFDFLSIGANVSYIFGNFKYSSVSAPKTTTTSTIAEERKAYSIRDLKYDLGVQYTLPLNGERQLVFGAAFSPKMSTKSDLFLTEKMYLSDPYHSSISPSEVLRDDTIKSQRFQLPASYGLGVTYSNKNLLVGLDGTIRQWKGIDYPDVLDGLNDDNRYNNTYSINGGAEYVIDPYSRNFFHRIRFRAGLSYGNSYGNVSVYNTDTNASLGVAGFKEYGAYFGLGLPFVDGYSRRLSLVNIGLSYTTQRPELGNMIKQDMFKISLNMNINELWFNKRRFN